MVLYVLYGGICELYQLDGRVRDEIDSWPEGMTYCLACSEKGPRLFFRKSQNQLQRLNPRIQRFYDTAITFRSLESAFEVLTGRMVSPRPTALMLFLCTAISGRLWN